MNTLEIKSMEVTIELGGVITSIIGPSNSGKTFLAKKICNKIINRDVYIDGKCVNEYDVNFLRKSIVVVLDDNFYNEKYVGDELYFFLNKLGVDKIEAKERVDEVVKYFKIKILDNSLDNVYLHEKVLIKILSLLVIYPEVIVIDNLLVYLDRKEKDLLYKYIKEKNISFVNLTTNTEELLLSDTVVVLNNLKAVMISTPRVLLDGNSILPYMGLKLPFIVDLSHNLILYNVVDKIYFDNRKLVDKLWK